MKRVRHLLLDDSTKDQSFTIFHSQICLEIASVNDRAIEDCLAVDGGGFGVDSQGDITRTVDVGSDFENDPDIFVGEAVVLSALRLDDAVVNERDLLADKDPKAAGRVMGALLKMKKLDIKALKDAHRG